MSNSQQCMLGSIWTRAFGCKFLDVYYLLLEKTKPWKTCWLLDNDPDR